MLYLSCILLIILGVFKDEAALAVLDPVNRQLLVTEAKNELIKAKEEENRKVQEQAKRLDYITRALRIESAEIIKQRHEKQAQTDLNLYNQEVEKIKSESKNSHETKLLEKHRLLRMQNSRNFFEKSLLSDQKVLYEKRAVQLKEKIIKEYRERKVATARRLYNEEQDRLREEEELERERKDKEERARIEKEQYEILRKKRLEQETIEKAKEAEEMRIKEEKRLELEAKRQKAIDDQKKAKLTQQSSSAAPESENLVTPSAASASTIGEKEIVWRAPPSSAMSGASRDTPVVAGGGPSKWRGAGTSSGDTFPSKEPSVSTPTTERWRPSGAGSSGTSGAGPSGSTGGSGFDRGTPSGSTTAAGTGAPSSWRGGSATGGSGGAPSTAGSGVSRSKLDDWGSSAPPASGGGGSGVSRSKLDDWG